MTRPPAALLRGDARSIPLADSSVDLIVTSPPYWALRSYTDAGAHYAGQIGDEPTPAAFVAALLDVTAECMRVLKPEGSLWVNLGDKYNAYNGNRGNGTIQTNGPRPMAAAGSGLDVTTVRPKSLIGIPWRYAIACIDDLGLILRAEVIWSKPNGMPESVTDRVRRSHEQWFHFTKQPSYYSAVDEIREPYTGQPQRRLTPQTHRAKLRGGRSAQSLAKPFSLTPTDSNSNPLGKLPGSVWTITSQPLKVPAELGVDHFAAFPMEWPRRIIRGWCPSAICSTCGEGLRPVVDAPGTGHDNNPTRDRNGLGINGADFYRHRADNPRRITGYTCDCPDGPSSSYPAVVLDPFGGTGTTALVAHALGRRGISLDMSADYCRLASWRTTDPGQIAKAMRVEKPKPQVQGQVSLLDMLDQDGAA